MLTLPSLELPQPRPLATRFGFRSTFIHFTWLYFGFLIFRQVQVLKDGAASALMTAILHSTVTFSEFVGKSWGKDMTCCKYAVVNKGKNRLDGGIYIYLSEIIICIYTCFVILQILKRDGTRTKNWNMCHQIIRNNLQNSDYNFVYIHYCISFICVGRKMWLISNQIDIELKFCDVKKYIY